MLLLLALLVFSCKDEVKPKHKRALKKEVKVVEPVEEEGEILPEIQSNFLKKLIKEEIGNQKYDQLKTERSPYSVHFPVEGDSYSVSFSIMHQADFNNDGIMDYVVSRDSEGMLGGNANSNNTFIYYIMKDEINYKEQHSILGYAPFSYNIIDEAKFDGDIFKIKATQNFRTYSSSVENLKSASFSFKYQNENLYEESYLTDCEMAKLESKTIFKDIPNVTKRIRSIEMHNYAETIEEVYEKNDTLILAELSGCDNLSLSFDTDYKVSKSQMNDKKFRKETAFKLLNFLAENTQFSDEMNVMLEYFETHPILDKGPGDYQGYDFRILIQKEDEKKNILRFLVQIDKITNPYQTENWDIATRNKTAPAEEEIDD